MARATGLHVRTAVAGLDRCRRVVAVGEFAAAALRDPIVSESTSRRLPDEAYLAHTGAERWAVQFGRSRWHWGPGDEASLLLSGTSPAFTGALLRASVPELSLDFAALNATLAATAGEQLAAHRVEWQPLDALRLGLGEAARYHADGWRPTYAVGVIPYVLAQRLEASDEPDSGAALRNNVEVAVDAAWRVAPGTRVYGELLVDDLHSKTANVPDKLGYQIGLEGAGLALGRRLASGAEYTRSRLSPHVVLRPRVRRARRGTLASRPSRFAAPARAGGDWQLVARSALTDRGDSSLDEPFVPGDPRPEAVRVRGRRRAHARVRGGAVRAGGPRAVWTWRSSRASRTSRTPRTSRATTTRAATPLSRSGSSAERATAAATVPRRPPSWNLPRSGQLRVARDDARDEPVLDRFLGAHPVVALDVGEHLRERLTRLVRNDLCNALAHAHDLLRLDRDVGRLPARAAARLVQEEARVFGRRHAPLMRCCEEHRARPRQTQPDGIVVTGERRKRIRS